MGTNSLNRGYIGINQFNVNNGLPDTRNQYLNSVTTQFTPITVSPTFGLDFTGTTWQSQVVFSRGGTATFLGSSGYITIAGPNVPRIQYDMFGNTLGLLIEPSVGVRWSYNNVGITGWGLASILSSPGTAYNNIAFAPDGTTTGMFVVPNTTTTSNHYLDAGGGVAVANVDGYLTHSIFCKKEQYTAVAIVVRRTSAPVNEYTAFIDLNNGNIYNEIYSDGSYGYCVVEPYTNNWWKISMTMKARDFTNQGVLIYPYPNNTFTSRSTAYAGSGTAGIYLWGSNFHGNPGPVQYINQNGMVTKAGDLCFISGNSFSSWYTYPGCFYVEYYNKPDKFNIAAYDGGNSDTQRSTSSTTILSTPYRDKNTFFASNGEMIGNKSLFVECLGDYMTSNRGKTGYLQLNKMVFAITGTTFPYTLRFALNGSDVQKIITSNFNPQGITCMLFGSKGFIIAGATTPSSIFGQYNGILRQFRFYNSDFTDDQLKALTI
jgi:hypothetical protein